VATCGQCESTIKSSELLNVYCWIKWTDVRECNVGWPGPGCSSRCPCGQQEARDVPSRSR